ncbi:MAG: ABC transporter permease [Acidimicrobiia bacterium]|nr:ABC transporter permease [Acidimicrobiia bacterium]MYA38093.1 ABC transporter permease [Acidimicrobiia bacterium]MYB78933.1 ABC transporter permease [Acidimicrobiia bacterium]MYD41730.1 ABC transporter permease [Acidimicrobiia bacterium]MYH05414.1 ABC transporter permease [Acidimicrobiia bacterium]
MTSWRAIRLVMGREVRERSRSGAFIVSVAITLLLVAAVLFLPLIFADDDVYYGVGVVGDGNQAVIDAAVALANTPGRELRTTIEAVSFASREAAERAADAEEVDGVLMDGREIVVRGAGGEAGGALVSLLQRGARSVQIESLVASGAGEVVDILTSQPLEVRSLSGADAEENNERSVIAFGGLMLLYMAVLLYGSLILSGVTEEKTNRVVEVLLAAFEPWQLLAGKILGIGLLGLCQFVGTVVIALVGINLTGVVDLPEFPIESMLMLVLWFILGYSLFAVMFGAAGALVSRAEDAQTVVAPISLVAVAGFFIAIQAVSNPTSTLSVVTTFIPPTAPFVAPVRFAFQAIPLWQMAVSVALMVLTVVVMTRLAGRVYLGGLLRFGSRVGIREAFRSAEL